MTHQDILGTCGFSPADLSAGTLVVPTPVDGSEIARLKAHSVAEAEAMVARARQAFHAWRRVSSSTSEDERAGRGGVEIEVRRESVGVLIGP
jgi:aldehyde dehydrogenase (NAD+)